MKSGFGALRLKESTIQKLRDWKVAIQETHQRTYTWEEFIDICLFDLEIVDKPGAMVYKMMMDNREECRRKIEKQSD